MNLLGVMTGSQLALQRFLPRRRGHIVNVASSAGLAGVAGGATYSASKHCVVGLTRALRALQTYRPEVIVPNELRLAGRLFGALPPRGYDLLKRLLRDDDVMSSADMSERAEYERRARE